MEQLIITDKQRSVDLLKLDANVLTQLKRNSWLASLPKNYSDLVELRLRIQVKANALDTVYQELRNLHELLWFASEFGKFRSGRAVYLIVRTANETIDYYCHIKDVKNPSEASSVWAAPENKFIEPFEITLMISPFWIYDTVINYGSLPSTVAPVPGPYTVNLSATSELLPGPTIVRTGIGNPNTKPAYLLIAQDDPIRLAIANIINGTGGGLSVAVASALAGDIWRVTIGAGSSVNVNSTTADWSTFGADHARIFATINTNRKVVLRVEAIASLVEASGIRITTLGQRVVVDPTTNPTVVDLGVVPCRRYKTGETIRFNIIVQNIDTTSATFEIDYIAAIGAGPSANSGNNNIAQLPSSYVFFFPEGTFGGVIDLLFDPGILNRNNNALLTNNNDRAYAGMYYTTSWENATLLQVIDPIYTQATDLLVAWIQTGVASAWRPEIVPGIPSDVTTRAARRPVALSPFREAR